MPHTWDPERYLAYADERSRPFADLLARVDARAPVEVVDLGCGPGHLSGLLTARWPQAHVLALDSSEAMIRAARARQDAAAAVSTVSTVSAEQAVEYHVADLRDWRAADRPGRGVDVLISNATLQWLPDHLDLLPRLLDQVRPGGHLAFQVPGNFGEPSHTLRTELAAQPPYAEHTRGVAVPNSHEPAVYYDALADLGCVVDVWETTYLHVLTGPDPVFAWVSGTGARPTLQALPDDLRPGFEAEFRARLAAAYPLRPDGTVLLPFRRIFAVAHTPAAR